MMNIFISDWESHDNYLQLVQLLYQHTNNNILCVFHVNSLWIEQLRKDFAPDFFVYFTLTTRWYGELVLFNKCKGTFLTHKYISKLTTSFDNNIIHHFTISITDNLIIRVGVVSSIDTGSISPKQHVRIVGEIKREMNEQHKDIIIAKCLEEYPISFSTLETVKRQENLFVYVKQPDDVQITMLQ